MRLKIDRRFNKDKGFEIEKGINKHIDSMTAGQEETIDGSLSIKHGRLDWVHAIYHPVIDQKSQTFPYSFEMLFSQQPALTSRYTKSAKEIITNRKPTHKIRNTLFHKSKRINPYRINVKTWLRIRVFPITQLAGNGFIVDVCNPTANTFNLNEK